MSLPRQGVGSVVRAFDAGEVSIQEIHEAYESGTVHELAARLPQGDAPLGEACDAALRDKGPER